MLFLLSFRIYVGKSTDFRVRFGFRFFLYRLFKLCDFRAFIGFFEFDVCKMGVIIFSFRVVV